MTNFLTEPLTSTQIAAASDDDGWVSGVIKVDLGTLMSNDFEANLDLLSVLLTGSDILMDISFKLTGVHEDGDALVEVAGDASAILDAISEEN